jgi:hypothetical protein
MTGVDVRARGGGAAPLASLAADVGAVAERLRLIVEESWDGLGSLRAGMMP